jgi:hypothetical protein
LVPPYKITDCGMVIEIELRQFRIEAAITLDPSLCQLVRSFLTMSLGRRVDLFAG